MSLLTQVIVAEKYGLRLGMDELADVLGLEKRTLYNQVSAGRCAVKTYLDAGKRWADHRDVAAHFDALRATAT